MLCVWLMLMLGRTFEEAIQKAVRMVTGGVGGRPRPWEAMLAIPTDKRLYAVQYALERGYSIDEII